MERKKEQNVKLLEEGSFLQLILRLSLPAMFVILVMIIYNMADTFFIGQTGDPNKISALSICMPIFSILSGVGTLFGVGGSTSISIALGEKNYHKVNQISTFCTLGCILVGVVFTTAVIIFTEPLAYFLGADASTIADTMIYLRTFAFAGPFVLFSNSYGNILRADGEAVMPMIANMAGSLMNIVLDAVFILGLDMDVFGAALASVLGNIVACVLVVLILCRRKPQFMPQWCALTFHHEIVIPVLTLGLPMTFSTILGSISSTVQNRLMMEHGSVFMAAQSISGKLGMLITMSIMGICMGLQPAFSYNYGSKNKKRLNQVLRSLYIFAIGYGGILAAIIFVVRNQVVAFFIDRPDVIELGQIFVLASVCVAPFYAAYQVCQTFLQATGKANYAIVVSLLDKGLIFLPVLFIMNHFFGAYGIAFAGFATMLPSVCVALVLTYIWKRK